MSTVKRIPTHETHKITFYDTAAVGVFDVKGWRKSYGILYPLSEFDTQYTAAVKLKEGEKVYRYETTTTAAGKMRPLLKVNTVSGYVYFLTPEAAAGDVLQFESRGTKTQFLNLLESQF